MAQLKDFQTGAASDPFNGAVNGTLGATTPAAATVTSLTDSGNLTFTGTGNRILGDFSNATIASRVAFQTSTTNGQTRLTLIPNGTGTDTAVDLFNNSSDLVNVGRLSLRAGLVDMAILSTREGTGTYLPMTFFTGGSEAMRITTDRSVGIGTISPNQKLQVTGSNSTGFAGATLQNSNGNVGLAGVQFSSDTTYSKSAIAQVRENANGTGPLVFYVDSNADAADWATGDEKMRILEAGNLLVGATSLPTNGALLHSGVAISAGLGYKVKPGQSGTLGTNVFNIDWTGSPQLWIDATNIGTIAIVSDYRIKKNIATQTTSALDRVMQLRPVNYEIADYGTLFKADGVVREGFIAHELAEIIPSAVEGEKDTENQIQSLKLDALCSVLTKAIQEQQALIQNLTTRLTTLEGN